MAELCYTAEVVPFKTNARPGRLEDHNRSKAIHFQRFEAGPFSLEQAVQVVRLTSGAEAIDLRM
jgi:hypothetical protein